MRIAVASGKGGTGKTTTALGLAESAREKVIYMDCDVEEPNGFIFLKPEIHKEHPVDVLIPKVNEDICTSCGKCREICRFNSIIILAEKAVIFEDLCHSCGGCKLVCPEDAITEYPMNIGEIREGTVNTVSAFEGRLNIGRAMAPPVIRAVKKYSEEDILTIIDSPPGTSCSMVSSVKGSDYIILVTEPTPFGLNDLKLALETAKGLQIPHGVIINRSDSGDGRVRDYLALNNIELLMEIPESRDIAESGSRGETIISAQPELRTKFSELIDHLAEKIRDKND